MITSGMKRRIKREWSVQNPTVWVGKEGTTTQIINEINHQLEQHEIVKARIHQTALKTEQAKNIATKIAEETNSTLIDTRGHTFILYKKRKKKTT